MLADMNSAGFCVKTFPADIECASHLNLFARVLMEGTGVLNTQATAKCCDKHKSLAPVVTKSAAPTSTRFADLVTTDQR
jgi:hypothetical protein